LWATRAMAATSEGHWMPGQVGRFPIPYWANTSLHDLLELAAEKLQTTAYASEKRLILTNERTQYIKSNRKTEMNSNDLMDVSSLNCPAICGDPNSFLIFGGVSDPGRENDASADFSTFLGRWEGYDYSPPVKKDIRIVLFIQKIDESGGEGLIWYGANLQYPDGVKRFRFRTIRKERTAIAFDLFNHSFRLTFDGAHNCLVGNQIKLTRDRTFCIYEDYPAHLESKRIYARRYLNTSLNSYGQGYLLYLPQSYGERPDEEWPLLIFFCGTADRGGNVFLLAKASPFMYIREKEDLPCIIVAPMLGVSSGFRSFPGIYMEGVFNEVISNYRVDRSRIYVTGLSMGGEAAYRFALLQPDRFAALVVLCGFLANRTTGRLYDEFYREAKEIEHIPLKALENTPVRVIHGENDTVVPRALAERTVDELRAAAVDVEFAILRDHDHDVWTDTYSDRNFYDWLFRHKRPSGSPEHLSALKDKSDG
jgi:acetyl esterase/lipase